MNRKEIIERDDINKFIEYMATNSDDHPNDVMLKALDSNSPRIAHWLSPRLDPNEQLPKWALSTCLNLLKSKKIYTLTYTHFLDIFSAIVNHCEVHLPFLDKIIPCGMLEPILILVKRGYSLDKSLDTIMYAFWQCYTDITTALVDQRYRPVITKHYSTNMYNDWVYPTFKVDGYVGAINFIPLLKLAIKHGASHTTFSPSNFPQNIGLNEYTAIKILFECGLHSPATLFTQMIDNSFTAVHENSESFAIQTGIHENRSLFINPASLTILKVLFQIVSLE